MVEELHKARGDMDIGAAVAPARFDQDHLCAGILAQPVGQDATRRAGTDDYIISPHPLPPSSRLDRRCLSFGTTAAKLARAERDGNRLSAVGPSSPQRALDDILTT